MNTKPKFMMDMIRTIVLNSKKIYGFYFLTSLKYEFKNLIWKE
ncbi:hypothetical protein LEP1GSC185_2253 [Leptospira licerasiae serovar Varillal str. VAR 010]|uniref:Uncharacterized protein n=1 Tax=Leptospira licerasiae str. MMD4847 TaxID=1049971 RepID=A0ABN0H638_9LEPT|nr:hypothetical protein LEP1GSC185_2253 [Leptospira licerasiae serovar Varillal str. VAR 010]EJZ40900.1 hypothetical protein LEP1GSC178_1528 [Leptospira licerasiae str. MMD4847]